jgi:hypothetical protein
MERRDPDVHDRSDRLVTSLYKEMPAGSQKIPRRAMPAV